MNSKPGYGIRFAATTVIWGFATAMLSICIPLVGMTGTPLLPLAAIVGATVSTVAIWRNFETQPINSRFLIGNVSELEKRIANLEMIASHQDLDWEKKIKQLDSKD